ncbi:hypothetical protein P7G87_02740 [Enterococcus asini]|uniref:hypothetical protein n=1 Tax=Enterococcus asini TaxID=57732 RepID=UPI00288F041C|nr:hypothetical protein [Enterococcus asini]MDT2783610.1 hypothetical protein [Enterococcus asini]
MKVSEAIEKLTNKRNDALSFMSDIYKKGDAGYLANEIRVTTYNIAINTLQQIDEPQAKKVEAHLAEHWNEDVGDVLWWNFPVEEPPYCGTPLDEHFPKYKTHFSMIDMPTEIEKPKRWVVKLPETGKYFANISYGKMFGMIAEISEREAKDAYPFTDRAKAEAVAVLVDGSVEEI